MGILSWIIVGTITGLAATWLAPGRPPGGVVGTVSLGIAGGFLGGAIFSLIADRGVARLDVVSLLVAFVGAAALLGLVSKADYAEPRTR